MLAYQLTVQADGWQRLCEELCLDGDYLLDDLPGYDTLKRAEAAAGCITFSLEEVRKVMKKANASPLTAEDVLDDDGIIALRNVRHQYQGEALRSWNDFFLRPAAWLASVVRTAWGFFLSIISARMTAALVAASSSES